MDNKNLPKTTDKELVGYESAGVNLAAICAEEMDGLTLSFDRIKVPAGGGIAFEVPGDSPESSDLQKEIKGVILYHHCVNAYYKEKYTGGKNPPDCGSMDGHTGIDLETGEVKNCDDCYLNEFGSGESGGKACKQRRRIYLLREGEVLPVLLSLPTGSLSEFSKYIMRLLSKGKKSNTVITKFTLQKAQNAGGISYSQAICSVERNLNETEQIAISTMSEQIKKLAKKVEVCEEE